MPVKKASLPLQPNPFASSALGSPWTDLNDVPSINQAPFEKVMGAVRQMRIGGEGSSIVLIGDPGSGKTHLLARVRAQLQKEAAEGRGNSIYVYMRCNASAGTLWRTLRRDLSSDLLKGDNASKLKNISPTNVTHRALQKTLENIQQGRHFISASAWLRGESLGPADLADLGISVEAEQEDLDREWEAQVIVNALFQFLAPTPVVLCFDQVEALEEAGFRALGRLVSELCDKHKNLLLISCIVSAFEYSFDRLPNRADRDRWLRLQSTLRPLDSKQGDELVKLRLDHAPELQARRQAHLNDPLWPMDPEPLKQLFAEKGVCLARVLLRHCEQEFNELMGDVVTSPTLPDPEFLRQEFIRQMSETRRTVAKQSMSKTLSDCLPWLLENSRLRPLGSDAARASYSNQDWRGPQGEIAFKFSDARGNALTNQLKRMDRSWNANGLRLMLFRDAAIQPGPKGIDHLNRLKQRGAREIHPLPEALAALLAIRNLRDSARSSELLNGDNSISENAVTDWALAHLPASVEALRSAIVDKPSELPDDPILPMLAELLNEKKVMAASAAASQLNISSEEVKECAGRHPMRFGLLVGPPVVVFDGTQGPKR